jgi:hypothetical protein
VTRARSRTRPAAVAGCRYRPGLGRTLAPVSASVRGGEPNGNLDEDGVGAVERTSLAGTIWPDFTCPSAAASSSTVPDEIPPRTTLYPGRLDRPVRRASLISLPPISAHVRSGLAGPRLRRVAASAKSPNFRPPAGIRCQHVIGKGRKPLELNFIPTIREVARIPAYRRGQKKRIPRIG